VYKILYPKRDATIYEAYPNRNTGIDQILELTKYAVGERRNDVEDINSSWGEQYNSRILLDFDLSNISQLVDTGSAKYYLTLSTVDVSSIQNEYTIYAYPITEPWINGNGNFNDLPEIRNGVSWIYSSNETDGDLWTDGSGTSSFATVSGGGSWNSSYAASQSFSFEDSDVRMDVTPIVSAWIAGDIPNYGMILKYSDEDESSTDVFGSLKFFSRETHTIYLPKIQAYWDSSVTYTGSFSQSSVVEESYVIYSNNLRNKYTQDESTRIRFKVRERYPQKTYVRSTTGITTKRLPDTTYYSIVDYVTNEPVVEFDDVGTKLDMDDSGHYIDIDFQNFLPVRYYKILLKVVSDNSVTIIDNNFNFRIE